MASLKAAGRIYKRRKFMKARLDATVARARLIILGILPQIHGQKKISANKLYALIGQAATKKRIPVPTWDDFVAAVDVLGMTYQTDGNVDLQMPKPLSAAQKAFQAEFKRLDNTIQNFVSAAAEVEKLMDQKDHQNDHWATSRITRAIGKIQEATGILEKGV